LATTCLLLLLLLLLLRQVLNVPCGHTAVQVPTNLLLLLLA
jgi:hypothetical protein